MRLKVLKFLAEVKYLAESQQSRNGVARKDAKLQSFARKDAKSQWFARKDAALAKARRYITISQVVAGCFCASKT